MVQFKGSKVEAGMWTRTMMLILGTRRDRQEQDEARREETFVEGFGFPRL